VTTVDSERVRAFRLARHHLDGRAPSGTIVEVARALCGVHAQLASSAELALWARVEDLRRDEVRDALEERRTLVKTWAMRGTLHLMPADDLPLYVEVLGQRWDSVPASWLRGHGITREHFEAIVENVPRALDGRPCTREELADRLAEFAGADVRDLLLSGWGALLKPSAHRGDLCFGPNRGRNVTFVRPDRWLDGMRRVEPEEATREVLRRYLSAYGPSTADDVGRWLGVRGAAPKRLLATLGDELADVRIGARTGTLLAAHLEALSDARAPRSVRLLPAFDPYVVGARPRDDFVDQRDEPAIFRSQGWISPVLLVDGQAAGVWAHERRGRVVEVRVEPFARLPPRVRRALSEEAQRLGAFLGGPAKLSVAG
jgi:hypothetical protein